MKLRVLSLLRGGFLLLLVLVLCSSFSMASDVDRNAITLIDQQDRQIEIAKPSQVRARKGFSPVTGVKSAESYMPILVEYNNENGGVRATAPIGINKASVIFEYQVSTIGTMGLCALFQDTLPSKVGPVGNASVGGVLIQDDWKCGYVYQAIPTNQDGSVSELGYSIQSWMDSHSLLTRHMLFPGDASKTKEWKRFFSMDKELLTEENQYVDLSGLKTILRDLTPMEPGFLFLSENELKDYEGEVPVSEIDIRTASRIFSSGFVYDKETKEYARWVGEGNQYGDTEEDLQLRVSNLIIQRVEYATSNKLMAPTTIGRGNADIFFQGYYIDGYWVRDSEDEHTRFYDTDGNPIKLVPGTTFVSLLSNSTSVVIMND